MSKVPREIENDAYATFWRDKKEYYGKFESGLLITEALVTLPVRPLPRNLKNNLFNSVTNSLGVVS